MGRGAFGAHLRAYHLFGDCRDGQGTFYRILLSGKPRHPDSYLHRQDDCRRACRRAFIPRHRQKERHCSFLCRGSHGRGPEYGALSARRRPDEGRGFSIPRHGSNGSGGVRRRIYPHLAELCAGNGHQRSVCPRDHEDRARRQQQSRKIPRRPRGERVSESERRNNRSYARRTAYTANTPPTEDKT